MLTPVIFLFDYNILPNQPIQVGRNSYLPERNIQTGIGDIKVKIPPTCDRSGLRITFSSNLILKYMRRTRNLEEVLPLLYLKGFPPAI
ncbi:MAG: transposase [Candidatus Paracaedibacteraceae bacterium]|nr:transposase [Candidatus Paracaedibacteraceae bacterium]